MKRAACVCCGFFTMGEESGSYDICPVCFWEDDPFQLANPDRGGGANRPSLCEARINFTAFGAYDEHGRKHARAPTESERPENNR